MSFAVLREVLSIPSEKTYFTGDRILKVINNPPMSSLKKHQINPQFVRSPSQGKAHKHILPARPIHKTRMLTAIDRQIR